MAGSDSQLVTLHGLDLVAVPFVPPLMKQLSSSCLDPSQSWVTETLFPAAVGSLIQRLWLHDAAS